MSGSARGPAPAVKLTFSGATWVAYRDQGDPSAGWYFYDSSTRTTQWEAPATLVPPATDRTDRCAVAAALDARVRDEQPELAGSLTRMMSKREIEVRKRSKTAQDQTAALWRLCEKSSASSSAHAETALLGERSWTHEAPAGYAADDVVQLAVAASLLASSPAAMPEGWQDTLQAAEACGNAADAAQLQEYIDSLLPSLQPAAALGCVEVLSSGPLASQARLVAQVAALSDMLDSIAITATPPPSSGSGAAATAAAATTSGADRGSDSDSGGEDEELAVALGASASSSGGTKRQRAADKADQASGGIVSALLSGDGLLGSSEEVASSRAAALFRLHYRPSHGTQLMTRLDAPQLLQLVEQVIRSKHWRQAIAALSDAQAASAGAGAGAGMIGEGEGEGFDGGAADPFLDLLVRAIADGPHRHEIAANALLAGDVGFSSSVARDAVEAAAALTPQGGATATAAAIAAASVEAAAAPLVQSELTGLLGAAAARSALQRLLAAATSRTIDAAVVLSSSLRLARFRETLGFGLLSRETALSRALGSLPADPVALLYAEAYRLSDGSGPAAVSSGPFEAGSALRDLALTLFLRAGAKAEFFPEEQQATAADSSSGKRAIAVDAPVIPLPPRVLENAAASAGDVDALAVGQEAHHAEKEARIAAATCTQPLKRAAVESVCRLVTALRPFMLLDAQAAAQVAVRAEAEAAAAGGEAADPDGSKALAAQVADVTLLAYAYVRRLLRQPDVVVLLLHCLCHPELRLTAMDGTDYTPHLAYAAAWAAATYSSQNEEVYLSSALRNTLCQASAAAILSDGSIPPWCTALPGSFAASEAAGRELTQDVTMQLLEAHFTELSKACKSGGVLHQLATGHGSGSGSDATGTGGTGTGGGGGAMGATSVHAQEQLHLQRTQEAQLLMRCSSHPLVSAGLLHFMRHMLLHNSLHADPRVLTVATVYAQAALNLAAWWPLLAPSVLALCRQLLQLSPRFVDAPHLLAFRERVAEAAADLMLATGYDMPVMRFVLLHADSWEPQLLKRVLARLVTSILTEPAAGDGMASCLSLPFALAVVQLVCTLQGRLIGLFESARVASATATPLESVGHAGAVAALLKDATRHLRVLGPAGWQFAMPGTLSPPHEELRSALALIEQRSAKYGLL